MPWLVLGALISLVITFLWTAMEICMLLINVVFRLIFRRG